MTNQTSFPKNMQIGFPGQSVGWGHANHARTYVNDLGYERKVVDVVITAANSHAYEFTVDGIPVAYTSDASATAAEVRDGLIANARSQLSLENVASFNPVAAGTIRVTMKTAGVDTVVAEADADLALTVVQAASAPEPIPFGLALVKRTGAGTTDRSCRLPNDLTDVFVGIAERAPQLTNPVSPDDKIVASSVLSVGFNGIWYVRVEEAVTAEDAAYFRVAAFGANMQPGAWRKSADNNGTDDTALPAEGCTYKTSAAAGGIAELRINR